MTATRWWERAACIGHPMEWWFPAEDKVERPPNHNPRAIEICNGCPVRQECLDDAIKHRDAHAIAGGLTPRERRNCGPRHGTVAGYSWHWKRGEKPCDACYAAKLTRNRENAMKRGGWRVNKETA